VSLSFIIKQLIYLAMKITSTILIIVSILIIIFIFRAPAPVQELSINSYSNGIKLHKLRTQYKMTLDELSKSTGLTKDYLKGVEKGRYILGEIEYVRLTEVLGDDFASL
jgi:hypothetical protein